MNRVASPERQEEKVIKNMKTMSSIGISTAAGTMNFNQTGGMYSSSFRATNDKGAMTGAGFFK